MKKIFAVSVLSASCLMLLSLPSCKKSDLDTDQFDSHAVALNAYGPQPVLRGGVLRFIGSNLDKITQVILPGVDPITAIEVVQSGTPGEIRITVPKDGPEPGKVTLIAADGTEIVTKTELTYIETVSLESFSPASAYPGERITLKGDYLNLMHEVIFEEDVKVSEKDFLTHDRYTIVVTVPAKAKTGPVGVGDIDELNAEDNAVMANQIFFETDLTVGVASVSGLKPAAARTDNTVKAGSEMTVTGAHLDLVDHIQLEGAEVSDFTLSGSSSLTFALPAEAADGEIYLVMQSGEEVAAGSIVTTVPSNLSADPAPVKAGKTLTVTGEDIDLAVSLTFPSVETVEVSASEGQIVIEAVPAKATEGSLLLTLANGKTAEVAYTLVKPAISALSATEVNAGESFTVTGADLDLVTGATLGGRAVTVEAVDETSVIVTTEAASVSGKLVLTAENGDAAEAESEITVIPTTKVNVTEMPSSASAGEEITLKGTGFNLVEAVYFGGTKVTAYSKREAEEMTFLIPAETETGNYNIRFLLTTGEEELCPLPVEVKGAVTAVVLFEGTHDLGNDWSNALSIEGSKMEKVPYTATLHVEYTTNATDQNWYQLQLIQNVGGWPKLSVMEGQDVISAEEGSSHYSAALPKQDLIDIYHNGLVLAGHALTLTKVYFTYENTSADPVFVSDIVLVDWDDHGGHNGDWDNSWSGNTELIDRYGDKSDMYIRSKQDDAEQQWFVNCNHQSDYTKDVAGWSVEEAADYVIKFDVLIEEGASALDAAEMAVNPVLGDNWPGAQSGILPSTTGGKWITVTLDPGLSGALDCSSGSNGFMASKIPAGINIDNFRLAHK